MENANAVRGGYRLEGCEEQGGHGGKEGGYERGERGEEGQVGGGGWRRNRQSERAVVEGDEGGLEAGVGGGGERWRGCGERERGGGVCRGSCVAEQTKEVRYLTTRCQSLENTALGTD